MIGFLLTGFACAVALVVFAACLSCAVAIVLVVARLMMRSDGPGAEARHRWASALRRHW